MMRSDRFELQLSQSDGRAFMSHQTAIGLRQPLRLVEQERSPGTTAVTGVPLRLQLLDEPRKRIFLVGQRAVTVACTASRRVESLGSGLDGSAWFMNSPTRFVRSQARRPGDPRDVVLAGVRYSST
jgi:hypothetical protein